MNHLLAILEDPRLSAVDAAERALIALAKIPEADLAALCNDLRNYEHRLIRGPRAAATRMVLGGALARLAHHQGNVAVGPLDELKRALNVLAKDPGAVGSSARELTEHAFAPLGAYLFAHGATPNFAMHIDVGAGDAIMSFVSGALAVRAADQD